MNKSELSVMALVVVSFVLIVYFSYNNYRDKQRLEHEKLDLTSQIDLLQHNIARNDQIIADNEKLKRELENQSTGRQEQINELLKDDNCANQLVPVAVSDSLYNRAKNLRQPTDTRKLTK